jgi:hypothetical protein
MSAAMVILPQVWATASLASAAHEVQQRKGPHRLQLVHASEQRPMLGTPRIQRSVEPGLAFYRKYTEGLLRRYMNMSMEQGRVPSLLGRELFQGNVSHYKVKSFDDVVIFVHDIGKCLAALEPAQRHLVRRIAIEGYTHEETAALQGLSLSSVIRRYSEGIDKLTRLLLAKNLLQPGLACAEDC